MRSSTPGRVTAVLGPTNTGKTHLALARLMGHASGVMGFPLRLLARENYDKVARIKGPRQVALLTGEEKIVPPHARYFLCTVESMPENLAGKVDFLAVDEVQLCADPERGHVFTDRLLHARGARETMFLGSDTIAPLLRRLVPEAALDTRARLSKLSCAGYKNIARLPPRSAVVAFSTTDVYALAELLRRQKGGAAVVLGALSPRTRNAQVGLYQAGEVEYLVATDAVGMGLNLDVNHVAFAGLAKYDGRRVRPLSPAELGQIAGRAGRNTNDGTFGVTADAPPLDPTVAARLEAHDFEPLRRLFWRNARLRFGSVAALLADLRRPPPARGLARPRPAEDERALEVLARDPEIAALAVGPAAVRLLWEVCQIPDFRKTLTDAHPRLLGQIYKHLRACDGRLPTDWLAERVRRLDRTDGDLDTLVHRIAGIRTWTYVSHRSDWLHDAAHWRELTRAVEDRLSDVLHEQLTLRFVDRRTSVLLKRLQERDELAAAVTRSGDVLVEGHYVGRLEAFHFAAHGLEGSGPARAAKAANAAALRALRGEMEGRVAEFCREGDAAFGLGGDGALLWRDAPVARLRRGSDALHPRVEALPFDLLEGPLRERVRARAARWFDAHLRLRLGPLFEAQEAGLEGAARGLAFQLAQGLGSLPRRVARAQVEELDRAERRALRRLGLCLGRESVFFPALLEPEAVALRAVLWVVFHRPMAPPACPPPGAPSVPLDRDTPPAFYEAVGYRVCGPVALRLDALERVAGAAWENPRGRRFPPDDSLPASLGCTLPELAAVLATLGFAAEAEEDGSLACRRKRSSQGAIRCPATAPRDAASPFAVLSELVPKS